MVADIHTCSYQCDNPPCIKRQRDELLARIDALTADAERWRETNRRLHRRTQMAESAVPSYHRLIALPPDGDGVRLAGGNFGRALLTWYCEQLTERAETAERELAARQQEAARES